MKKLFLLILLLAAAWGYYEGMDQGASIHPHSRTAAAEETADPPSVIDRSLTAATDAVRTLIAGIGSASAPSPAGKTETPAPAAPAAAENTVQPKSDGSLWEEAGEVYDFPAALESRIDRTRFTPSARIPDLLKKAVVAAEDRRFYEHGALDIIGIARAAVANYSAGETVEGGSTIAQQTVKNIFLSHERTFTRKARELLLAIQLERLYTKDQILELYLNTIYFGHGAYGIGEAARTYFGKAPEDLTLSECALLAGLPQAPSAYDPIDHPEEGRKRMTTVLMLMAREGYITPQEAAGTAMNALLP